MELFYGSWAVVSRYGNLFRHFPEFDGISWFNVKWYVLELLRVS